MTQKPFSTASFTIIGGGLAGAACALHFMRDHPGLAARITLVEPRPVLGAGLAYSTPAPEHRINVAASRMSVLPELPGHFHDWLTAEREAERDPASAMPDGRLYPSRRMFGAYVDAVLRAQIGASPRVEFRHVRQLATRLQAEGAGFRIGLASGEVLEAGAVVLAMTHAPPEAPGALAEGQVRMLNPWDTAELSRVPAGARVLIVGTGLTACDVIATLSAQGHEGPITAVSRHGLLPRPRTMLPVAPEGDFSDRPERAAIGLLRRVRRALEDAAAAGRPWEGVIDALRQQAPAAWGTLDWDQRRSLLRHLRTHWDVHRYQCAPQIEATLARLRGQGTLRIVAARLVGSEAAGKGALVSIHPRGAAPGMMEQVYADVVVNCTGPGHRSVTATNPVLHQLASRGDLLADPAALGIWVDAESRVLRRNGLAWPNLFVAGPLARGTFGELMGLPQVNLQPRAVAANLAALIGQAAAAA